MYSKCSLSANVKNVHAIKCTCLSAMLQGSDQGKTTSLSV